MIELKHVTFQYENAPKNVCSIRNINLTVQRGECVVLCGKSGCGKTTITRLINGLIPHYYEGNLAGYVSIDGTEIKNQQLSIARALLKDAPIVLLDEATASLDPESESSIQQESLGWSV